ncbi:efflux transporter outer membrane subunit [uncultured Cyclobacterium sp.]|uniref:efflux transporter outer membrane subunit n=1 Tax=uncultured Cyclobacterium sp. TaxID=453820 RepID=UPI0030ED8877|tara:strand:+ start:121224 stop:122702 length:1479 start_codon:yes stop_codon:yes gene_type:complete
MSFKNKLKYASLPAHSIILLVIMTLWGCKSGENYVQPNLNLPDAFKSFSSDESDNLTRDTTNIGKVEWRMFFEDTTLLQLIDDGLSNNLYLKQIEKESEIANESFKQSKANFLPQITAVLEKREDRYSRNSSTRESVNFYGDTNSPNQWYVTRASNMAALQSSWEIDLWGKLRRLKEANLAQWEQRNAYTKAVKTDVVAEIATSYYKLLMLKEQQQVAEYNLRLNDSTLSIVKLQYRAGEVSSLAITQTESQKLISASLVPQIERELEVQKNKLNELLGEYPKESIDVQRGLGDTRLLSEVAVGVPLELIKNRPDVYAAELALVEANAQVGVSQAMRYPSLSLNAQLGYDAINLSNITNPSSLFGVFIGSLTQPIFQNRKLKTRYRISLSERDIAELAFREKVIQAVADVSNGMITIQKLEEEYELAERRLTNARKAVKESYLLFSSGYATYLEVINAQSNALESELYMVDVKMQMLVANIELYRNLGGGWN